jgi:drug/metabolite transporter (DMT)-like permease
MAILLALLAASTFAMGSVLQQKGTLETSAEEDDSRFLMQILRRPVWLAGGGLQASGWVLQAAALDRGSLVVVQSLTATSLVIALPLGAHFTDQQISRWVIIGSVAIIVGIFLFLSVGSPQPGTSHPTSSVWLVAGISGTAIIVLLVKLGRSRNGATKALLFGSAAGVGFAFQATVTKEFMTMIGSSVSDLFSSWEIYALVATAVVGFVLQQSSLKTGLLAPAMASSNSVTLFASVVLGIVVFGEKLSNGSNRLAPAFIGLAIALVGVVLLAGTKPPQASEPIPFAAPIPEPSPHTPDHLTIELSRSRHRGHHFRATTPNDE